MSAATGGAYPPTPAQRRAADPRRSVWVAANAGTGKTRVLADRVLRLLLAGAHPESILCITFTRAGAAEMGERIERRLAAWAVERDQGKLRADLEHLTGEPPSDLTFARARKLFAQVLDLSHGLRIMTIHALCQTLLKRFPLEAEVAPHFETIDDRTAEELKAEARGIVLAERCRDDKDLGRAVELLAVTLAESTLSGAIAEMLAQRHRLTAAFARHCERGTCAGLLRHIDGLLEVEAGVEPPHLVRRACADGVYDADGLLHLANTFRAGGKRQQEAALSIATWLGRTASDRHELYEGYRTAFFTKDGQPRGNVLSAAFRRDRPDVARLYDREQARLGAVRDQIQALTLSRRTAALLRLGHAVIDAYEGLKRRSALLDFDDLVERTRVLLSTSGRKEWVLYKLDQRLDHVLVDEAQDTSPSQWGVVEQLTEEFVAGAGARGDAPRTLFIVGDEKQSIYSFQGADLANFRRVRARLLGHAEAAGLTFGAEALDVSFRTSRAVLEVVDRVLALPEMAGAVTDPAAEAVLHATSRKHHAGLVELWPLADHEDGGPEPTAWPLPDRPRVADEPERRVAGAIAAKLRGWFEAGEVLEATGQPLRPVDVLILVSRRGTIQEAIIRALKREGVPVAGADRLLLGEHIAVKDLVALGRAILLPEDDLTLACLLKSPLLGLDEDHLFALAWDRGRSSLLERLRERSESGEEPYAEAYAVFAEWLRRADFMPPFEFYCSVLSRPDRHGRTGRHRLLERLGPDAQEPIEAFLSQALAYERGHPASLEGFLHWLGLGAQQLKRDPEQARDAVRVMTVHGAKGLEAPVVFLADAGPQGGRRGDNRLLWLDDWGVPVWRARKEDRDARCQGAAEAETRRERDERLRLLYVALTRARDRLYVTGWRARGGRGSGEGSSSWHELLRRALADVPDVERFEVELGRSYRGDALRLRRGVPGAASQDAADRPAAVVARPLPPWATSPAAEETAARPLAPSRLASEEEPAPDSPAGAAARERIRHGLLVHRLLQVLPGLPAAGWEDAGERLLARLAGDLDEAARALLLAETLGVLRLPDLAALFGPGSRPEQPVCGLVGGRMVAGQVDRLVATADAVLIADYKTTRRPPAALAGVPVAYLRQMAAYRSLLLDVYPGRDVRAALVWTQGPRVTFLPPDLLDAQLRTLNAAGA